MIKFAHPSAILTGTSVILKEVKDLVLRFTQTKRGYLA